MKAFVLLIAGFAAVLPAVNPDLKAADGDDNSQRRAALRPKLHWKYGWNDGLLANTTGSFRGGQNLPSGTSILPPGGYTPAQVAHAYGFDALNAAGGNGTNRTIAIVVAYGTPTLTNDLSVFCSRFGLPAAQVTVASPVGVSRKVDSGWAGETMMDVEWAHAMSPAARLLVVVSPDASTDNLNACVQYAAARADVVSMSWGGVEDPSDRFSHFLFTNPAVSFVAAAGDTGARDVEWPASDPSVLGVGGTSLLLAGDNTISSETAWSGGSGGVSRYQQIPAYQSGWTAVSGRSVPDVSYLADPYTGVYVYVTDPAKRRAGWSIYGGTSAGAPQWAALLADRMSLGSSALSNASLYGAVAGVVSGGLFSQNAAYFRDITQSQPYSRAQPYVAYPPTAGFDLVTGLGSPLVTAFSGITGVVPSVTPTPTPSPTPTPTPTPTATPTPTPSPSPTTPTGDWWWWRWWWRWSWWR